jgi:signal transduction histidine kinase
LKPSLDHLWDVIESARELATADQQSFFERIAPTPVEPAVRRALEVYASELERKQLSIKVELEPAIHVRAHPDLLAVTILANLVSNALKFSPLGGCLTVSSEVRDEFAAIWVGNEGDALDTKMLNDIRAGTLTRSASGTSGERGHGFGLRLVRDFAIMMGGHVVAENVKAGVRIGVAIPLADP